MPPMQDGNCAETGPKSKLMDCYKKSRRETMRGGFDFTDGYNQNWKRVRSEIE